MPYLAWRLVSLAWFSLACAASFAWAGEQLPWKLGLAKVIITPTERMQLSGYASRVEPFQDIEHDLYAKVAVLEDEQGHRGVLITADLIGFFRDLSEPICQRIK